MLDLTCGLMAPGANKFRSELNIPESRKANEERGVRFVLPAAPNEVVTRP